MREFKTEAEFDMHHAVYCDECNVKATQIHIHAVQENCDHKWEKLKGKKLGCRKCYKVIDAL
jgi:uncharacterized protein with PIN domain